MSKEMVCISCPVGCRLTVKWDADGSDITIEGNQCSRGEEYGREEALAPKRTVTATVHCSSRKLRRPPVRTDGPLDISLIPDLLDELYTMTVNPPLSVGDTLIENFRGTGIRVVATRTLEEE